MSDLRQLEGRVVSWGPPEHFLNPCPVTVCREDCSKAPCQHTVTVVTTESLCMLAFLSACRQQPVAFWVNTGSKAGGHCSLYNYTDELLTLTAVSYMTQLQPRTEVRG